MTPSKKAQRNSVSSIAIAAQKARIDICVRLGLTLNDSEKSALDGIIQSAIEETRKDEMMQGWNEGREHQRKCDEEVRRPLVKALEGIRKWAVSMKQQGVIDLIDALAKEAERPNQR